MFDDPNEEHGQAQLRPGEFPEQKPKGRAYLWKKLKANWQAIMAASVVILVLGGVTLILVGAALHHTSKAVGAYTMPNVNSDSRLNNPTQAPVAAYAFGSDQTAAGPPGAQLPATISSLKPESSAVRMDSASSRGRRNRRRRSTGRSPGKHISRRPMLAAKIRTEIQ
jgi:hypothetical protein